MKRKIRHPRRWKVVLHVTDRPKKDEAYMSAQEIFQIFKKMGDLPAGIKIHMIKPEFVPEAVAKNEGARWPTTVPKYQSRVITFVEKRGEQQ